MEILHILNGDSTLLSFEQTGLEGDALVWREVLSEGPLQKDIRSGSFWRARAEWMIGTPEEYQQKVLDPLALLNTPFDEINLWFEFDLHCQANLLGVMNYIKKSTDLSLPPVYLICPSSFPGMKNFRGMGELNGEQLEYLYDNARVPLSEIDFVVAAEAWEIFVLKDANKLQHYLETNVIWGNLKCLQAALIAQLNRLRPNEKGLNSVEQKLFDICNTQPSNKNEVYRQFWETEAIYGMGDWEIDMYLNRLRQKGLVNI